MRFNDYFDLVKANKSEYGRRIGVDSTTVQRWLEGVLPGPAAMLAVYLESNGRVGPADWYPEIAKAKKARRW